MLGFDLWNLLKTGDRLSMQPAKIRIELKSSYSQLTSLQCFFNMYVPDLYSVMRKWVTMLPIDSESHGLFWHVDHWVTLLIVDR